MARQEYAAKGEEYRRKKEETAVRVVQAYLAVGTAKEYVRVARAGIDDAGEHSRIAEARYRNGLGLYSDVLRARTAVIEAEQRMVTAEKSLSVAKRALAVLLGASEPVDTAPDQKLDFPMKEMEYYQNGAASRKDVKALQIRYENAKNGVKLAESKYLPTVAVRASYQLNDHNRLLGTEGESWWLMGVLRWDLFDGASREYERVKARHKQAETEEQLKGLKADGLVQHRGGVPSRRRGPKEHRAFQGGPRGRGRGQKAGCEQVRELPLPHRGPPRRTA